MVQGVPGWRVQQLSVQCSVVGCIKHVNMCAQKVQPHTRCLSSDDRRRKNFQCHQCVRVSLANRLFCFQRDSPLLGDVARACQLTAIFGSSSTHGTIPMLYTVMYILHCDSWLVIMHVLANSLSIQYIQT